MKKYKYLYPVEIEYNLRKQNFILIESQSKIFITNGYKLKKLSVTISSAIKKVKYIHNLNEIVLNLKNNFGIVLEGIETKKYLDYNLTWKQYKKIPVIKKWFKDRCNFNESELVKHEYILRVYYENNSLVKEIQVFCLSGITPNLFYKREYFEELFESLKENFNLNYYYNYERKEVIEAINSPYTITNQNNVFSIRFENNFYLPHIYKNETLGTIEIDNYYTRINNRIWVTYKKHYIDSSPCQYIIDLKPLKIYKKFSKEGEIEIVWTEQLKASLRLIIKRMKKFSQEHYESEIKILKDLLKE